MFIFEIFIFYKLFILIDDCMSCIKDTALKWLKSYIYSKYNKLSSHSY